MTSEPGFETGQTFQDRIDAVRKKIAQAAERSQRNLSDISLIAVSKTFGETEIIPVIETGQRVFGENRIQESQAKWPALKCSIRILSCI